MVLSDNTDEELSQLHQDLCTKLNLDPKVTAASWDIYESISKKFVLEGDKLHWLGCAIYVVSRGVETPTLDNSTVVRGMGINLTSLLRHSNLSFVQFFTDITRFSEMAQLSDEFRNKINYLRSNFSIAYNTFKTFQSQFTEIFASPIPNNQDQEASRHKNRRNRAIPCTPLKVFEFVWNLFITAKSEDYACSNELIKSHHLLYCCMDLAFKNVIVAERRDLINSNLVEEALPFLQGTKALKDVPCIVTKICKGEPVIKEALHMKTYKFRELIKKLLISKAIVLNEPDFTGIFDADNFDQNFKTVTKAYETHLLSYGDFDERIFFAEFKRVLMEKDQSGGPNWSMKVLPTGDSIDGSLLESPKISGGSGHPKGLDTPLTGRQFLGPRESDSACRSTSEKISRLRTMMGDRTAAPSDQLKKLFEMCKKDPLPKIEEILTSMKDMFITSCTTSKFPIEEAQNRVDFGITLFYKYVEMILNKERTLIADISALVEKEIFYQCMFACCLEIVLYCYDFPKKFPWILETLRVEPVHFVKVIELIVRTKDNLFRELIKHLNRIEETVIESLAWKSSSPIWEAIENSGQGIPKFQDTALPGHLIYSDVSNENLLQSPGPPSATDCFQSPLSQLCKNLFPASGGAVQLQRPNTHIALSEKDGSIKLIPLVEGERTMQQSSPGSRPDPQAAALPRRTGSLSIIFRKFYNLASVRMQHLCSFLRFDNFELRQKIWTIFEDSIRHTDLIKDRHLDQLLMCAIYVICKASNVVIPEPHNNGKLFAIIMKFYRQQPQASSSVYRDVLIEKKVDENGRVISEERKDLIHFYNTLYIEVMKSYAMRFKSSGNATANVALSPLPANSILQVVANVFVKPLETPTTQTDKPTYNYYFSRSPSKDLMNINRAINNNVIQGKRLLIDEDGNIPSPKRISNRKIQSLMEDRQRHSASE